MSNTSFSTPTTHLSYTASIYASHSRAHYVISFVFENIATKFHHRTLIDAFLHSLHAQNDFSRRSDPWTKRAAARRSLIRKAKPKTCPLASHINLLCYSQAIPNIREHTTVVLRIYMYLPSTVLHHKNPSVNPHTHTHEDAHKTLWSIRFSRIVVIIAVASDIFPPPSTQNRRPLPRMRYTTPNPTHPNQTGGGTIIEMVFCTPSPHPNTHTTAPFLLL